MIIRKANLNDLEDILNLSRSLLKYEKTFDETIDVDWFDHGDGTDFVKERILNGDGVVFVAVENNKIIGYLVGGSVEADSYRTVRHLAEIEEIMVDASYRGLSTGSKLIEEFFNWSKDKGFSRMRVVVSATNIRTISLYKRLQFIDHDMILERQI